ncbi:hypothetical protein TPHA_0L00700 [Tetrapisispora phaffii CBS 4417]|uniref:Mitochondrial nicotinamide adenine dinucleotide transporter 1 n=1 Tax=Tetrapisispora phaffii (strain ATCC 24235 / CBS 4417 / NBRC 1672 / NRRL Y-8282 / UCD 70-5) TaxID=1071381 RepID=G8BZU8_TETPH|nr:hypothetical protein TPHA_0L00700 [Tetrapisispora phaffii CBS 4417]CCE65426.1 hypothetical protein TPHA_0L00700 [Tetrapisispora phaffii CBS 4417]
MKDGNDDINKNDLRKQSLYVHSEFICPDGLAPLSSAEIIEPLQRIYFDPTTEMNGNGGTTDLFEKSLAQYKEMNNNLKKNLVSNIKLKKMMGVELTDTKVIAISGAVAGFFSGILVCPLDVTKTRLQAQGLQSAGKSRYYNGLIGTINTIVKDEGILGLYKGIGPILMGYLPSWMIYFSIYEVSKDSFPKIFPNSVFLTHFFSALTAGSVSTILTNPIWVIKTRLMLQNDIGKNSTHYKNTIDAFIKIYKQEGPKAFYAGLLPSLFGLFHVGIQFPIFENLKTTFKYKTVKISEEIDNNHGASTKNLEPTNTNSTINLDRLIMASCLSKMIASLVTYPHEILRTRMQLKSNLPPSVQRKIIPLIKKTYTKEGFKGFYSGFFVNLLRTVPASVITLVTFEYVQNFLRE